MLKVHRKPELTNSEMISVLMDPASIVFIGASSSPEKPSGQAIRNIYKSDYTGEIYPVNVRGVEIDGNPTYTSVEQIPGPVDVGFITIPAKHTPNAVNDLSKINVKVAIVAVGGFAELGSANGKKLQEDLIRAGKETGIRLVGPVCNGIYSTHNNLALGYNALHGRKIKEGSIGLISHSGAMLGPYVSAVEGCGGGLSRFVSCGSEADLSMSDYMEFLVDDDRTNIIALIVDRVGDGAKFRSILQKAAIAGKPVVALKLGDSTLGKKATMAHSSHLSGAKEAYDAVLRAEGVIRVPTLECLAITCAILDSGRKVNNHGVVACSTSGGGAILLADLLDEKQIPMIDLAPETVKSISKNIRFESATILNPFDLGLGGRDYYIANVKNLSDDPNTGVLLGYATPMATPAKRSQMAHAFTDAAEAHPELPVIVIFPGKLEEDERIIYEQAKIPVVPSTLEAVAIVKALLTPKGFLVEGVGSRVDEQDKNVLDKIKKIPGGNLSEAESKNILLDFGVIMPKEFFVKDIESAIKAAEEINYPVVLKACGRQISHKTEYKLVEIGIDNEEKLLKAWDVINERLRKIRVVQAEGFLVTEMVKGGIEVIFGVTKDSEFGNIAVLGVGGILAELLGESAISRAPLPLSESIIHELISMTHLDKLLSGYRDGVKLDRDSLVTQVYKICQAVEALGERLQALDVNPILVKEEGEGAYPVDSLFILH